MKITTFSLAIILTSACTVSLFAQQSTGTRTLTSQRDVTAYMEELSGTMVSQLKSVQDDNAALETRIVKLEQLISELEATNKALRAENNSMKTQISALTASNASCEKMLKNISAQLDKIAAGAAASSRRQAQSSMPTPVEASNSSYAVYKVQEGATLSAIATAYGVTVNDIKKANNLKSDFLRIGQELKIPVK